jgi:hypothetical protein
MAMRAVQTPAPAMIDQGMASAVVLPQTATPAQIKMILGALAMMAALVLLVWQFRRGRRA